MKSNVSIGNHPLHPILVLIPAGLWIGSLIFDIVFRVTGNPFWFQAASWNILFGLFGAFVAALAGLVDLITLPMSDAARRTGITHMSLNLGIVFLYAINLLIRGFGPPMGATTAPFVLNIISVTLLLVSGWLGGELIYRHGIAIPEATAEKALRYSAPCIGHPGIAGAKGGQSKFPPEDHPEREA
jgi:uncharacterized membrane protein